MSNSFGSLFRISTWGESHGGSVGVVVDGCPPGLPLDTADIQVELDRRRPGQSDITTPRKEADEVTILSGIDAGCTLGTPIAMNVRNKDHRPGAYNEMKLAYRPSTPTTPTTPNTGAAWPKAVAAPAPARPSGASPPAPLPARSSSSPRASKFSPMSNGSRTSPCPKTWRAHR